MASRLLAAGHRLVAYDVRAEAVDALAQGGPEQDFTNLITHIEKWAGVTVGGKEK